MSISINGERQSTNASTLQEALENWGAEQPCTVAVNQQFIPKHQWQQTKLQAGDAIEVLTPISGG